MSECVVLEEAGKIDWSRLCSGWGGCDDVLRGLAHITDPDPQVQQEAYWCLDNHVVVQRTLYEGAFYVIPFVLEWLRQTDARQTEREELYDLLIEIAGGYGSPLDTVEFEVVTHPFVYYLPKRGGRLRSLNQACREAVMAGWERYRADALNTAVPGFLRCDALTVMDMASEGSVAAQTVMQEIADKEPDSEAGQFARECLSEYVSREKNANRKSLTGCDDKTKVGLLLAVAEKALVRSGQRGASYEFALNAMNQCRTWHMGFLKTVSADTLYRLIDSEDGSNLEAFAHSGESPEARQLWRLLADAVAYIAWTAYRMENAAALPPMLRGIDGQLFFTVMDEAIESDLITRDEIEYMLKAI